MSIIWPLLLIPSWALAIDPSWALAIDPFLGPYVRYRIVLYAVPYSTQYRTVGRY